MRTRGHKVTQSLHYPGWTAPGVAMTTIHMSPIRLQLVGCPDGQFIWVAMVTIITMCDLFCKL